MQAEQPGLGDQAFGKDADSLVTVQYQSHRDALKFIEAILRSRKGVGVLQGPGLSGKTTIVRRVKDDMADDTAVALLDGTDIWPNELLSGMLSQYGYNTGLQASDELLQMVSVFAVQQAASNQPPVLIVDNVEHMSPKALRTLNQLARLTARFPKYRFAMRILLTGDEGLSSLIASEDLAHIARRHVGIVTISPLSDTETMMYLHARLTACGVQQAATVFPVALCARLRELSGGWPGLINHYAQEAIRPERPRLIVTRNGETVSHYNFSSKKVLIGRSEFADVVLEDRFASKLHVALLLYSDALVLLDLNSANGTTVNSVKVGSTVLQDDDIISIGHYRLKVKNAPAISEEIANRLQEPDTIRMRNLAEMRRLRERQLVMATENMKG